jgi:hypothetical protein
MKRSVTWQLCNPSPLPCGSRSLRMMRLKFSLFESIFGQRLVRETRWGLVLNRELHGDILGAVGASKSECAMAPGSIAFRHSCDCDLVGTRVY